jgi:hypothetical protein
MRKRIRLSVAAEVASDSCGSSRLRRVRQTALNLAKGASPARSMPLEQGITTVNGHDRLCNASELAPKPIAKPEVFQLCPLKRSEELPCLVGGMAIPAMLQLVASKSKMFAAQNSKRAV